jgi:bifunctional non-homologous end joining protein LigD
MSLSLYKQKRHFDKTPEPTGGKPSGNSLRFVVQKHHASHLHYDFRLEMRGVLKSWAIPKGPSLNPSDKRLAMLVEDHPWDYRDFEGIIPSGYGAGTVIVWDEGTYLPAEKGATKEQNENRLLHDFYAGSLSFILKGKKLKGEFSLVKTAARGENAWLLIKKKDAFARDEDISKNERSVKSGKTIQEVKETTNKIWQSHRPKKGSVKSSDGEKSTDIVENSTNELDWKTLVKKGKKSAMPSTIKPMLCTLLREPVFNDRLLYEVKWDGYRIIAFSQRKKVRLDSRSGLNYTSKYPPVVKALQDLPVDVLLDGEVVVLNEEGRPDFNAVQNYNGHDDPIFYYVFDVLWIDGVNIMLLPLHERKQILQSLVGNSDVIKFSESFDDGEALFKQMQQMEMEGMVGKEKDSVYVQNERGKNWLKMPTEKRQEFVIGGWAESERGRSFRSLLFGAYNNEGKFEWIGRSGGGYKDKEMPGILKKLQQLEIKNSPFVNPVLDTKGATIHFVKPQLVANFSFAAWTNTGRIRKPATFLGFRNDKKAKEVVREIAEKPGKIEAEIIEDKKPATAKAKVSVSNDDSNWKKIRKPKSEEIFEIAGCSITIGDVEREPWKGITKADLIQYYHSITPYILPHIKDRPQSLHIKPTNAVAPGFYIKDMEGHQPDCAEIFTDRRKHKKKGKRDIIDYLVCNNEATLLYMINLGCIDINPWTSRISTANNPDYVVIDLDPSDEDFKKAIETAQAAKEYFDKLKLKCFVKTSGKTGMHLLLPCKDFTFSEARTIAINICEDIHEMVPNFTTTEVSVSGRKNKLYIDPNQNDYADTIAAPYSARPYYTPTVSTPLDWKEVNAKLDNKDFTIKTILNRVKKKGDLFKELYSKRVIEKNTKNLKAILNR